MNIKDYMHEVGRACARAALSALGHGDAVIGRHANCAPLWPDSVVGSITHTSGYAAALVADATLIGAELWAVLPILIVMK